MAKCEMCRERKMRFQLLDRSDGAIVDVCTLCGVTLLTAAAEESAAPISSKQIKDLEGNGGS